MKGEGGVIDAFYVGKSTLKDCVKKLNERGGETRLLGSGVM